MLSEVDLDRWNVALDHPSRAKRPQQFVDVGVALGVRTAVEVAGAATDAIGDLERSLVLSEATGHGIPVSGCRAGQRPFPERVDNRRRPLGPCEGNIEFRRADDGTFMPADEAKQRLRNRVAAKLYCKLSIHLVDPVAAHVLRVDEDG